MSGFGANPTTGTQVALPANQFPLSSVAVPGTASGNLTALEGGPASTDSNGNSTAPASMYVKDGSDVTQGLTTDAAVTTDITATISAKLRGLVKISGDIWDSTNHRIRVDGSGVTQPISAASLPLPSGAATSAKQPALGTAGTASSDVITVQGIASMTALKVDGSGVTQPVSGTFWQATQPVSGTVTANVGTTNGLALDTSVSGVLVSQASTTSGQKGPLIQGAVTTSAPTYTTAQTSPISLTTAGAVRVDGSAVTQPVSGTFWQATQPVSGTVSITSNSSVNVAQVAGTATDTNSGNKSAGTQRIVIATDQPALTNALKVDGSAVTQPVSGTVTANVGTTNGLALDTSVNGVLVSQGSTTSGEKGPLIQGAVTTSAPTYTTAQTSPISLTTAGAVRIDGSAVTQPVSGTFWQATQPVSGTVTANVGTTNGLALDTSVNGVLVSQGSTTSGEKGPMIQGAVTTNAPSYTTAQTSPISLDTSGLLRASLKDTPSNTNNLNVNLAASAATVTVSATNLQTNINQIAGSAVSTAATGIMKVGVTDGSGTAITSTSSALDVNIKSGGGSGFSVVDEAAWTAGTSTFVPAGGVFNDSAAALTSGQEGTTRLTNNRAIHVNLRDASANQLLGSKTSANSVPVVVASDQGAFPVSQSGSNWSVNVAQIAGSTTATAATGVQKVGVVGNGGATIDSTVAAGSAPTNAVVIGAVYNSSAPTPTSGQAMAVQADQAGNMRTFPGIALAALSAWNSGTSLNATQNIFTNSGAASVLVQLTQTTTLTAGAVTFEVSYDGSNWSTIPANCALDPTAATFAQISLPYTVQANTNKAILLNMNGAQGLRAKLSTQISGSGTVTPNYALLPLSPADTVIALSPTAGNFNVTASQGGTWNITNVSGTVSLPTGAATSAKQPALGTAGSASADVITVQGIASMTALKVDGSGVTQPVSGTVTANQGGSNWSVNVAQVAGGNASNAGQTGAMQVGGAVATNTAVSSATNPLLIAGSDYGGTPKVQSLKVDSSGNAQVAVTNTPTVTANAGTNLNTSALALDTSVNGVLVAQGSTTSGQSGPIIQGAVTTNAPSYTTAKTDPLSLDTSGLLRVSLKDTPSNTNNFNVNLAASAATVTVSATNLQTNLNQVGGTNVVTGGASGLLAVGGPVASGASNADNPVKVGGAFNTTQPTVTNGQIVDAQYTARGAAIVATGTDTFNVTVNAALPAGGNTIGAVTQASGPWTSNITQFGGNNIATGTGAGGTGIPRVTVSNDSEIQLWDGTNGPVAVKAAGTAPAIIDKAIVAALSPNNTGLPVNLPGTVQSHANKSSGSVASLAQAFTSNNIAGNSIIVVCSVGNGTAPTISDTNSNTYTQVAQIANSTTLNVAIFLGTGATAGNGIAAGANTVTVNNGGTTASIGMEIYEISGLITQVQAQPDQTATNTGTSGTASTSSISASSPNEIAFAGVGIGTAAQTITVGSGWTNDSGQQNPTTPAGLFSFVSMSQFLGSLKAVTPQATFTSEPWAIAVATFRPVVLGVEGTAKITDGTTTMGFGSKTSANSMPVVVASDQGAVAIGVASGTALTADQSNTILKASLYVKKTTAADTVLALGSATSANSVPVVIASDQAAVPASQSGTWTQVPNAATSGGSTPSHTISASGTNSTNLKGSAGQVYGFSISNSNAAARFFKLYDKATAPTIGTDTPKMTVQVPASGTVIRAFPVGLVFSSGISWGLTTGIADSDTGSVGTDISVDIDYK